MIVAIIVQNPRQVLTRLLVFIGNQILNHAIQTEKGKGIVSFCLLMFLACCCGSCPSFCYLLWGQRKGSRYRKPLRLGNWWWRYGCSQRPSRKLVPAVTDVVFVHKIRDIVIVKAIITNSFITGFLSHVNLSGPAAAGIIAGGSSRSVVAVHG